MPRIRSIKPEFWTSAQVLECSTNARLLFLGLLNFCDDSGRHPASQKQVKASVFPADDFDLKAIRGMLDELSTNGLICYYVVDNIEYFYITGWHHQRIDKPQPPKYPDPFGEHSKSVPRVIPPDRIGEDKIGEEKTLGHAKTNGTGKTQSVGEAAKAATEKDFLEFWAEYPRKIAKQAAQKAYAKARRSVPHETIIAGLRRAKPGWHDPKFIPHASTWINGCRWDDDFNLKPTLRSLGIA